MKLFPFFLLIILFSSSVDSTEIATFKISYVIDNSLEFDKFEDKLDALRNKMQNQKILWSNYLVALISMPRGIDINATAHFGHLARLQKFWSILKVPDPWCRTLIYIYYSKNTLFARCWGPVLGWEFRVFRFNFMKS